MLFLLSTLDLSTVNLPKAELQPLDDNFEWALVLGSQGRTEICRVELRGCMTLLC